MSVEEDARQARANALGAIERIDHYHQRIVERLDAIQWVLDNTPKDTVLREALKLVSKDMHHTSNRPCSTCQTVTNALGEPFGCVAYAQRLKTPSKAG